ncbi:hypothetical protein [Parabacteroides goldsteinii]|uniref:hypothetical protein n=1 Tax=Parabacteroides goldsteinii TaxID=328812 RepID=UPI00189C0277|nr:hypothetical protein [Parabacteroides goldsteinii]
MTILDVIKAACKTKGVPEKYAERIQKTFKIEKAEGMEAYVDLFKENVLPAIQEAENEAKTAAEAAAVSAYETKFKLKDGKPVESQEETKAEDELLKGLSPEVKAYLERIEKKFEDSIKKVDTSISNSANEAKKEIARKQLKDAGLPESWLSRVDLAAETTIEDQVKNLSTEYTGIQQKAIDDAVARGDYAPGSIQMPERSEADWIKLMDQDTIDANTSNPGVVNLGIE